MKPISIVQAHDGQWKLIGDTRRMNPVYTESLLAYTAAGAPLFEAARERNEFDFILALLGIKRMEDAGWDAYANTLSIYRKIIPLIKRIEDFETSRHLTLWLYGHIVEASEPYEIAANLLRIISGGRFTNQNFPDVVIGKGTNQRSKPVAPIGKIEALRGLAEQAGYPQCVSPFESVLDSNLRNAIFHSDYALYDGEIRIRRPQKIYTHDEIMSLINRALAYHETWNNLRTLFIGWYKEPKIIAVPQGFTDDPDEKAITIIRANHGVVGLKDNWTREEVAAGHIPFRIAKLRNYERKLLDSDPTRATLPRDRIECINFYLRFAPRFVRARLVKALRNKL